MSWSRHRPLGFLLLFGGTAHAQEIPAQDIAWTWHQPPGLVDCPDASRIRERVEQRLGPTAPDTANAPHPKVAVELEKVGDGHVARVRVQRGAEPPTVRELTTEERCGELTEPLTLTLTLLLAHPSRQGTDSSTEPAESAPPSAPHVTTDPSRPPRAPRPYPADDLGRRSADPRHGGSPATPPSPRRRAWLGVGAVGSWAQLPELGFGGTLQAGLPILGPLSLSAGASYLAPRHTQRGDARFAFSATEAWLGVGGVLSEWRGGVFELEGALLVGWLHAIPESIDPLDPGDAAFGGLRLGAALRQDLGRRIGVGLGVGSHLLANTWRFRVRNVEEPVWEQPRAGARAEVLVIYRAD